MKKRSLKLAALLSIVGATAVEAREIRTPLPFMNGHMRYPIEYHWENDGNDWCLDFDAFGGAYCRTSDVAYSSCHGRNEVSWTNLLFGKSDFRFEEIFAGADIGVGALNNPFIAISNLKTRYDYNERGAVFGATLGTNFEYCDTNYRVGLRARLPFRDIEVTDVCGNSDLIGEQLDDVYQERQEEFGEGNDRKTNTVYAIRLDFLSTLKRVALPEQDMVNYRNADQGNNITIAEQIVGHTNITTDNTPAVAVIGSSDGSMPTDQRWGDINSSITGGKVAADGSGIVDNARGYFDDSSTDYTALSNNTAAQSQLFVVPTLNNVDPDENELTTGATNIQAAINLALKSIQSDVKDFIYSQGLDFCDGRSKGLGDLDFEFFLGRNWGCEDQFWTDAIFAVRVPTADDECDLADCKKVLKQPLGNGGHTELRFGLAGGWEAYDWFKVMADLNFSKVLSATEKVAAPFKGATVKNIGPCVNADIDWWYLNGHLDLSFFASDCCGFDFGYEIYHKDKDDICLCSKTAQEFQVGSSEPVAKALDSAVLAKDTERTAHKFRVGFFTLLGDCELFGGWSHVFAGKNVPRETDWYCSMNVSF